MADRPLSAEEAALWARVLTSVRPLRVAPAPVARVKAVTTFIGASPAKVGVQSGGVDNGAQRVITSAIATGPRPSPGKRTSGAAEPDFAAMLKAGWAQPKPQKAVRHVAPPPPNHAIDANTLDGSWDKKLARGLISPDCAIDLHGHNLSTAYATLDGALEQAIRQGDRVVLLVTGKPPRAESEQPHARGAIRAAIGDWLAGSRHAGSIAAVRAAHPRHGGAGALYIILRKAAPKRLY